jgi:hypothetical protein
VGIVAAPAIRPHEAIIKQHAYHPNMFQAKRPVVEVNQNVENAWTHFLKNSGSTMNFDFREKILLVALEAFGTMDFKAWVDTQFKGPSTGELHAKFIEDTLGFILTGKREMSLQNWEAVLTMADIETNITQHTENIKAFFLDSTGKTPVNYRLQDVLIRWCGQEGGIEDLVQTLHVLFGDIVS